MDVFKALLKAAIVTLVLVKATETKLGGAEGGGFVSRSSVVVLGTYKWIGDARKHVNKVFNSIDY